MAGKTGRSGRRKTPGQVYDFHFYYRFTPGQDPPELKILLEELVRADGRKRRDILRAALLGGARQAQDVAQLVNQLFNNWLRR
jgi:hypothetical protein